MQVKCSMRLVQHADRHASTSSRSSEGSHSAPPGPCDRWHGLALTDRVTARVPIGTAGGGGGLGLGEGFGEGTGEGSGEGTGEALGEGTGEGTGEDDGVGEGDMATGGRAG